MVGSIIGGIAWIASWAGFIIAFGFINSSKKLLANPTSSFVDGVEFGVI